jgi:dolichol kinase
MTPGRDAVKVHSILLDLPVLQQIAARIGVSELRRRLVHMSPALLPFLLWGIPHRDPWGPILINVALAIAVTLAAMLLWRFSSLARTDNEDGMSAVIGYAMPILMIILLLPARAELAVMTLGIIAIGDGTATLGGMWFGGRRLPWNPRKTFSGLACFCICGTLFATIVYWGEARPAVSWTTAFLCAASATLAAALVESLPLRGNDNFRVASAAALVGAAVQIWLLGL